MDAGMKDLERLSTLDPARGREPTAAEWARSRAFVERVMAGEAGRRPAGRPRAGRWLLAGTAAVATGAVAAVLVPALLPGAAEKAVASWTAVPSSRTGEQVLPQARACAGNGVGGSSSAVHPQDVLLAEQRGVATLLIMRKAGGEVVECLSVGDDAVASMGLTGAAPPPVPPAGTVNLETMSSLGDGDDLWSNIVGLAGPGVTAVELRLDDGRLVQASVRNGWWAAWWPGPEGGDGVDRFTVVVHSGGGTTSHRPSQLP
jgi:hypothetical protein